MTEVIKSLTPEQEAQIPIYLEKTLKEGLSTEPCDRPKVEKLVVAIYKERGFAPPKKIYWANSPKEASELHMKLAKEAGIQLDSYQIPQMKGNHDLHWLGFYGFLVEVLGLKCDVDIAPHLEMARSCGWWMPFEDICICCERHNVLKRDEDNNLHCADGPAVAFPDGTAFYYWHGVAVPEEWILNPDGVDVSQALTWENIEQRRCLAEILGWARIVESLEPTIIDTDPDPLIGQLIEVDLPDSGPERFLRVQCGTGRPFVLFVDRDCKTALEANARTYRKAPHELKVEVRT